MNTLVDPVELNEIKATLLAAWEAGHRESMASLPLARGARPQAMPSLPPPRPGLAVGHSIDPRSGKPQLELRSTASRGQTRVEVRKLQAKAQSLGLSSVLRVFLPPKVLPHVHIAPDPLISGRRKPLHLGASVAHERGEAGSLGAFVRLDDGATGILSCVHVLAQSSSEPGAQTGDPIQQPGSPEPVPESNRIGELTGCFAPFVRTQRNNLDAAIARLRDDVAHIGNQIPEHPGIPSALWGRPIGEPMDIAELQQAIGTSVCKIGRTTAFTKATLVGIDFQNLAVAFPGRDKPFIFSGVHEVRWDKSTIFSDGGDSGALVLTLDGLRPLGINFCAHTRIRGERYSYVVPWSRIASLYGVTLL